MNNPHQNARLTPYSREQIVARVAAGQTAAEVAAAFAVSVRTVRKWLARFRAGGGAALVNHASAPVRVSGRLEEVTVALIVHLRRALRMTGGRLPPSSACWPGPPSRAGSGAQGWGVWRRSTRPNPCAAISASGRAS